MGIPRKPKHTEIVLEQIQVDSDTHYIVVESGLGSLDEAQKRAKQLAASKLGTVYVPGRIWPAIMAQVKNTVKYVDPDDYSSPDAGETQALFGESKEDAMD